MGDFTIYAQFTGGPMMAGLFALFALVFVLILWGYRRSAVGFIIAGVIAALLVFWHLATDILKINL